MKIIIIIASILTLSASVKLPSTFQKCDRKKPNLHQCVLQAAQDGVAKLTKNYDEVNLPNLEPFAISETRIEGGTGPVAVNQIFKNCKLYGLSAIKIDKFEFDFEKKTLDVVGVIPEVKKKCDYEMTGQVLIIPVNGQGNSTITLQKLKLSAHLIYEEKKKRDKTYLKYTSITMSMDPELVVFDFHNHRDSTITDNLNPVLNENWKEIFNDVKGGYTEIIKAILIQILNNFFSKVSIEEALD